MKEGNKLTLRVENCKDCKIMNLKKSSKSHTKQGAETDDNIDIPLSLAQVTRDLFK